MAGDALVVKLADGERVRIMTYSGGLWLGLESGCNVPADNQTEMTWEEWEHLVSMVAQARDVPLAGESRANLLAMLREFLAAYPAASVADLMAEFDLSDTEVYAALAELRRERSAGDGQ